MQLKSPVESSLRILTLTLIAAFVGCGVWGHLRAHCFVTDLTGPMCGSDRIYRDVFGVDDAPEKLIHALDGATPGLPVAVLAPTDYKLGPVIEVMAGSLAWPRRVLLLPVGNGMVGQAIRASHEPAFAAFLFIGISPPASSINQTQIGPLTIIRNSP